MKVTQLQTMPWIDHWIGLPLCFLCGLVSVITRKILPLRKKTITGKSTIVVFKFFGLGSIMEATPLLKAIRKRYPEARLSFLTFSENEILLQKLIDNYDRIFFALLKRLDLFLTFDSGPLHLGASLNTPIVSLWGPTRLDSYCPKSDHIHSVFTDYHYSPCDWMFTTYKGMWCNHEAWCIQEITPDKVIETVNSILDNKEPAG